LSILASQKASNGCPIVIELNIEGLSIKIFFLFSFSLIYGMSSIGFNLAKKYRNLENI
jgi:hypothetical protein